MSGRPHHDDDLDDAAAPDPFEVEGIQAFNRLAGAVQGLESRLVDLELGLGRKVSQAEQAAAKAEEAAKAVRTVVEHARGSHTPKPAQPPPGPSWALWRASWWPGAPATGTGTPADAKPAWLKATGPP